MHHGSAATGGICGDDGAAHGHGFEHAAGRAFTVGGQHVNATTLIRDISSLAYRRTLTLLYLFLSSQE